jgi:hypothetical protein
MTVAEEMETKTEPRQRRLRAKTRWEPSTDHRRGSSHDSRDDDDLQHTVDEAVPHTSKEAAP